MRKVTPVTPVTPIDGWFSVQCAGLHHDACRPDRWECHCVCHSEASASSSLVESSDDVALSDAGEHGSSGEDETNAAGGVGSATDEQRLREVDGVVDDNQTSRPQHAA